MKLPFEEWLERQSIPLPAKGLFEEAIVCYKASAHRASLLFSFLGLQTILKYRVLEAKQPDYYHPKTWESICNNLRKQEKWDEEVNECVKKNDGNKKVFNISEDLRNQYAYWKYRRNDCAHSKENAINHSHVEAFWLFLQSNLAKFAVNGSMESLLEKKINKHFDIKYTSSDKDYTHIIADIPHAVNADDLQVFFKEINDIFLELNPMYIVWASNDTVESYFAFWDKIFNVGGVITEKLVGFFEKTENESLLMTYIEQVPQGIVHFRSNPQFIRSFWYEKLVDSRVKYKVLSAMLRQSLIPNGEEDEAFERLIINARGAEIRDEDLFMLKEQGFIEKLRYLIFLRQEGFVTSLLTNFSWTGDNVELVLYYINKVGLDREIAQSLIYAFSGDTHPWKLRDALKSNFEDKPALKEEFQTLAQELGLTPPERLGFTEIPQQTT